MSKEKGHGLGEWEATAICGNDITSSCLYVSALSIMYAGQWAWVSLFFTRGEDISNLNLAMLYVRNNEHTNKVKIVTVIKEGAEVPPTLKGDIEFLDRVYDEIDIDFVVLTGTFNPSFIHELSERWSIPTNFMFIATPRGRLFTYTLAELGGVRLII